MRAVRKSQCKPTKWSMSARQQFDLEVAYISDKTTKGGQGKAKDNYNLNKFPTKHSLAPHLKLKG